MMSEMKIGAGETVGAVSVTHLDRNGHDSCLLSIRCHNGHDSFHKAFFVANLGNNRLKDSLNYKISLSPISGSWFIKAGAIDVIILHTHPKLRDNQFYSPERQAPLNNLDTNASNIYQTERWHLPSARRAPTPPRRLPQRAKFLSARNANEPAQATRDLVAHFPIRLRCAR